MFLFTVFVSYSLFFLVQFPLGMPFLLFIFGLSLGYCFHLVDRFFQVLFVAELKHYKHEFLHLVKRGRLIAACVYLINKIPSMSFSFYFLALYFPLAFYLISSSGSVIGVGLMLGLGLSYVAHFVLSYKKIREVRELYFHLLSSKVTDSDIQKIMGGFIGLFILLSLFVIF